MDRIAHTDELMADWKLAAIPSRYDDQPITVSMSGLRQCRYYLDSTPSETGYNLFLTLLLSENGMLAKRTSKNQVTLPKSIVQTAGESDYYEHKKGVRPH